MADTLLERLRVQQEYFSEGHGALHKEAADEIERLTAALKPFADAYEAVEREAARLTAVNPKMDWQFAGNGYRQVLAENVAPTWFRDAHKIITRK